MAYQCPPPSEGQGPPPSTVGNPGRKITKRVPQRNVDEFWDKFTTKFPGKIHSILPSNVYAKTKAAHSPVGLVHGRATHRSYDEAVADCRAAVDTIARECRRVNLKYRDPHFDIEFDLKRNRRDCLDALDGAGKDLNPKSVKRVPDIFDNPIFFKEGATANDVRQGSNGDCWLLSALCAITNKKDLVDRICVHRDERVGVYGFVFHRDGSWIQTIIDDKLYLVAADYYESVEAKSSWEEVRRLDAEEEYRKANQTGSRSLRFAQCADQDETWLPLLEKAFAKAHGDYGSIDGGFTGEAIEDLTGGVTTELLTTDILDTDMFWTNEVMKVNAEFLFGCATGRFDRWQGSADTDIGARKGVIRMHAYSVMEAREVKGERLLRIRNPWGNTEWKGPWSDGSEQWTPEWMELLNHRFGDDGMFWISFKDFLRKYQSLDRTRLFGPEWSICQQWTTVNVPWSADYNETKFSITVTKPGPVVIVLSQLDDRYFRGLDGQYTFQLRFRFEKDGDESFMVRSHNNYSMSRSVSTDIELEPGTYSVLMKISAKRFVGDSTADQVIRDTCMNRPDKLIQVGLSYDLAHAKGEIKETEKEKATLELREQKKKDVDHQKRRADVRAAKLKIWEVDKKGWARKKRQAKRKAAYFKMKAEKAKAAEAAEAAKKGADSGRSATANNQAESAAVEASASQVQETGVPESKVVGDIEAKTAAMDTTTSAAPLSPPPETPMNGDDEAGWVNEDEAKESAGLTGEEAAASPADAAEGRDGVLQSEEVALEDDGGETDIAEDEDWECASDASFQSSIITDLDFSSAPRAAPKTAAAEDGVVDEANVEFEDDPWNAVCVVGLKVYSKDKDLCVETIRPKHDVEESDTPLDVDDTSKGQSVERTEEIKA